MPNYEVRSLDMWGHVSADCHEFDCPCMRVVCGKCDIDFDGAGDDECPKCHNDDGHLVKHDDDRCECSEECNNQFRVGSIEVADSGDDAAILDALLAGGFLSTYGREVAVIDDFSDGSILDVNDVDGRRLLHLVLEESEG